MRRRLVVILLNLDRSMSDRLCQPHRYDTSLVGERFYWTMVKGGWHLRLARRIHGPVFEALFWG